LTNAVGLEREGGNNAAVEGSLNAPQVGGGRASRRAAAAEVVEKTGRSFYCVDRCKRHFAHVLPNTVAGCCPTVSTFDI